MKLFPAIDVKDGKVVRLVQGDFDKVTVYSEDPAEIAKKFKEAGADHLHMVDLDGAKDGKLVNFETIKKIANETDMFIQVGGGIRDEERIRLYLEAGVDRVILGSAAVEQPEFLEKMVKLYGEKIAVGVDVKDGKVAIHGWKTITDKDDKEFIEYLISIGVKTIIYTDITKDGAMEGTNIGAYKKLRDYDINVIAAGGIMYEREITELQDLVDGAIIGKALYTGDMDLARCIELAGRKAPAGIH